MQLMLRSMVMHHGTATMPHGSAHAAGTAATNANAATTTTTAHPRNTTDAANVGAKRQTTQSRATANAPIQEYGMSRRTVADILTRARLGTTGPLVRLSRVTQLGAAAVLQRFAQHLLTEAAAADGRVAGTSAAMRGSIAQRLEYVLVISIERFQCALHLRCGSTTNCRGLCAVLGDQLEVVRLAVIAPLVLQLLAVHQSVAMLLQDALLCGVPSAIRSMMK